MVLGEGKKLMDQPVDPVIRYLCVGCRYVTMMGLPGTGRALPHQNHQPDDEHLHGQGHSLW